MGLTFYGIIIMSINSKMHSILISFITATDLQRHTLSEQFKQYKNDCPRIRTIPVGSIESLQYPEKKENHIPS